MLRGLLALLGHGILVGKDGVGGFALGADGVYRGHDGQEVLELVEVGFGDVHRTIERVDERRIKGPEGQLGDDVAEIEFCGRVSQCSCFKKKAAPRPWRAWGARVKEVSGCHK